MPYCPAPRHRSIRGKLKVDSKAWVQCLAVCSRLAKRLRRNSPRVRTPAQGTTRTYSCIACIDFEPQEVCHIGCCRHRLLRTTLRCLPRAAPRAPAAPCTGRRPTAVTRRPLLVPAVAFRLPALADQEVQEAQEEEVQLRRGHRCQLHRSPNTWSRRFRRRMRCQGSRPSRASPLR